MTSEMTPLQRETIFEVCHPFYRSYFPLFLSHGGHSFRWQVQVSSSTHEHHSPYHAYPPLLPHLPHHRYERDSLRIQHTLTKSPSLRAQHTYACTERQQLGQGSGQESDVSLWVTVQREPCTTEFPWEQEQPFLSVVSQSESKPSLFSLGSGDGGSSPSCIISPDRTPCSDWFPLVPSHAVIARQTCANSPQHYTTEATRVARTSPHNSSSGGRWAIERDLASTSHVPATHDPPNCGGVAAQGPRIPAAPHRQTQPEHGRGHGCESLRGWGRAVP